MKRDHERKEELKKCRDKEKLMNKIKTIKDEEEKEKLELEEHFKTKINKKIVERVEEDEELILDEDEQMKLRKYRRKEDGLEGSDEELPAISRTKERSRSASREKIRKPYSRDQSWSPQRQRSSS